ncbi:leucine-rich repeat domain-containing protein [Ulvibacter antarcticus]|nr:T9SS type A sorting domain-containing protein [Ulvibacter antarcticus]
METKIITLLTILIGLSGFSQQTYVPDDNFEQALIDLGYDTVLDDYVTTADISSVTSLTVDNMNIADLTGIEDFVALTYMNCSGNLLTSLDLSQNTNLENFNCSFNQITSLDITNNLAIIAANCRMNEIATLNVSPLANLTVLKCSGNPISSLDLTQNSALEQLECGGNQLNSLDLTQNPSLYYLLCAGNPFSELNVSQNPLLEYLGTNNCESLTSLDLSQNLVLKELSCVNNLLTELDLSIQTDLTYLNCNANQLTNLNVKNGNNTNVTYFVAMNNSNLNCITVDDVAYSTTNWTDIDPQTSFNLDCSLSVGDHDLNESVVVFPNPTKGVLNVLMVEDGTYNILTMSGQILKTGLINNGENRIDVSSMAQGIYVLNIKTMNATLSKKLILN